MKATMSRKADEGPASVAINIEQRSAASEQAQEAEPDRCPNCNAKVAFCVYNVRRGTMVYGGGRGER